MSFFGFDLTTARVTGSDGTPGYYIVIQEHPTEPRFGLDVGTPDGQCKPPCGGRGTAGRDLPLAGLQWGRNAAHMAGITRQLPVRIAIHASQFVEVA